VKAEHLVLRALMRNVILWDAVNPSVEWVLTQLPQLLRVRERHFVLFPLLRVVVGC
jgi:hypothetical protein